jgi:hypothetical protein
VAAREGQPGWRTWPGLRRATPGHADLVKQLFFDGLDPALLPALQAGLEQIHEQILAHGTLPRPPGHQSRWPTDG